MSTLYLAVDWMAMATPQTGKSVTTVREHSSMAPSL